MTPDATTRTDPAAVDGAPTESPARVRRSQAALGGQIRGLPGPFCWLWVGTPVNRAGTFIEPFFVLYLTGPRHVSIRTAGFLLTVRELGALLSQPLGGALTDRLGRRATLAASLTATAIALSALAFAAGWSRSQCWS